MPKILITGATGLLGRSVYTELTSDADHEVVGLGHSRIGKGIRRINLTQNSEIEKLFAEEKPDYLVHCAAERRPDACENNPEATTLLNVDATRKLAQACKANGTWFIYISTDYVFDGTTPPYSPNSQTNPLNHYGASKLAGEKAVQSILDDYLILRVPVLFGTVETLSESSVTAIAKIFSNPTPQSIDHWAIRYPTDTDDVAGVIAQIIEYKQMSDISGIYHWSGNEAFTKFEIAQTIAKIRELDISFLTGDTAEKTGTARPRDCQLDSSDLEKLGISRRTYFRNGIRKAIKPFILSKDV